MFHPTIPFHNSTGKTNKEPRKESLPIIVLHLVILLSTLEFFLLIPRYYKQALELDEQNGNSKWYDATKLEMANLRNMRCSKTWEEPK